jgi:hypothetical protein
VGCAFQQRAVSHRKLACTQQKHTTWLTNHLITTCLMDDLKQAITQRLFVTRRLLVQNNEIDSAAFLPPMAMSGDE